MISLKGNLRASMTPELITFLYWPLRYPPVVIPARQDQRIKEEIGRPTTPARNYSRVGV